MRTLPPAGGFPNAQRVAAKLATPDIARQLRDQLTEVFDAHGVSLCGSGTVALKEVFSYLRGVGYERVFVSAYSCPDIVAAAARLGLQIIPVDLRLETLEMLHTDYDSEKDIVVLSNLYGMVDQTDGLKGFRVVDDACQGGLSAEDGHRVGSRGIGVLSFGRGKAYSGLGGGAVLGLSERETFRRGGFWELQKLRLFEFFERPEHYAVPASLPFLGLGETKYEKSFSERGVSDAQIAAALVLLEDEGITRELLQRNASRWTTALAGLPVLSPSVIRATERSGRDQVLVRYPILLPDLAVRERAFERLNKLGLGVSRSYPAPLTDLCRGEKYFERRTLPGAREISRRILTLPVHRHVQESDIERTTDELVRILC